MIIDVVNEFLEGYRGAAVEIAIVVVKESSLMKLLQVIQYGRK